MRNPNWQRDEIILALDLYFDEEIGSINRWNPKIIKISEILNSLPIFPERPDEEKFRNPNGVTRKLLNLLYIDPDHPGKGLSGHGKLDEIIFYEFQNRKEDLKAIAHSIKKIVSDDAIRNKLKAIEDDKMGFSVREGEVFMKLHKYKERDAKIVKDKKNSVLDKVGKLTCEVCGFDFFEKYGKLGEGFIECHHIKPLATYEADSKTSINDLALVCSNCHRMLHRGIDSLKIEDLTTILSNKNTANINDTI